MINLSGGPFRRKIQLRADLLLEVDIRIVRATRHYPEGIRYRCYLGNPQTREVIVRKAAPSPYSRARGTLSVYDARALVGRFCSRGRRSFAGNMMKVKRITIGMKSWEESKKELKSIFHQVGQGKPIPEEESLSFTDLKTFRKCLTPKRLALLWTIAEHRPQSVRELAALVRREVKNVSEDLEYLCQVGLIEFRPNTTHGNARAPVVPYDRVDVSLDLRRRAA